MAFFNYITREITLKVVYYGPGLSGKTTNLQHLYSALDPSARGKFISLATESDRTLFFDFLPVELGRIKDFSVRFQLYTVPGQIRYNATRKLVLKGADAVVFVADSQRDMREQNIESITNMRENLVSNGIDPGEIPVVLQYNKRDLPNILPVDELERDLNGKDYQCIEAVAVSGKGVEETFRLITKILLKEMVRKHKVEISPVTEELVSPSVPEEPVPVSAPPAEELQSGTRAEDVVSPNKEEIFPETREDTISVKIPDRTDFEIIESRVPPSTMDNPMGSITDREIKPPPFREEARVKAREKSKFEADDFHARQDVSEPRKTISPPKPEPPAPPAYPAHKIDPLLELIPEIRQSLAGIKEGLSVLSSAMRESGRQQADMVKILRDIRDTLTEATRKRRWFHFFLW